jgi:hypothetical protein
MYKKNRTKKEWYQYHKKMSGQEAVNNSSTVRSAREMLSLAESNLRNFESKNPNTISSSLRKMLFGNNQKDDELERLVRLVNDAKSKLDAETSRAYSRGESSYVEDWLSRNPDKDKF